MFEKGGKLEKLYYLFEAGETFLFSPNETTHSKGVQIRDAIDLKRMMMTVVIAMLPPLLLGIYNIGYQNAIATGGDTSDIVGMLIVGTTVMLPMLLVSYTAGGLVEAVFAVIRKHPINEGFLVTGMLVPLVLPPTIPLWQIALATIFAVIIAKEVFGGTGMNVLNVAMTARAFLYFAYPGEMSGEVWTYLGDAQPIDSFTGATALSVMAETVKNGEVVTAALQTASYSPGLFSEFNLFLGLVPGSVGETSTLMALIGAGILIFTGVGSWKIIASVFGGAYATALLFNAIGLNTYMEMPAHYHLIIGGLAFGAVYMATDPVSAAHTELGKWVYGFLIGLLTVLIRVVNPAYPEGIMMAVLLMNVFAPLIDYYVINANKKRRLSRATAV